MAEPTPKVSLCMPVYNGENYVRAALDSILAQTFTDFELIVTDNASTDATGEIVSAYAERDSRIRYVRNQQNVGAAKNYNLGYEMARGEYLKWCAHDDMISENFLEVLVKALDENQDASLAFGQVVFIDSNGGTLPSTGFEMPPFADADAVKRFFRAMSHHGTNFPIFGLYRMSALKRTTLHRPYYSSDRALLAEMAMLGRFVRAPEATFFNREHTTRSINIGDRRTRNLWQNGTTGRVANAERLNLLVHLFEIAGRHPDVASPTRARIATALYGLHPRQLVRYAYELIVLISPTLGNAVRPFGRRVLSGIRQLRAGLLDRSA